MLMILQPVQPTTESNTVVTRSSLELVDQTDRPAGNAARLILHDTAKLRQSMFCCMVSDMFSFEKPRVSCYAIA